MKKQNEFIFNSVFPLNKENELNWFANSSESRSMENERCRWNVFQLEAKER